MASTEAAQKARAITAERLIDKAERLMMTDQLSPVEASEKALPRNLYAIKQDDLRELLVVAISLRLGARETSRRRTSDDGRTAVLTNRYVQKAVERFEGAVKERAKGLAAIPYNFDNTRFSLLDLPLEGHKYREGRLATSATNATARASFHARVIELLEREHVERICDLPGECIIDLGIHAEGVWER